MEYIGLRKIRRDGLTVVRRQVVRLKKMGKPGKEIEEITGVRQNRISEIWRAYQREGESYLQTKKRGCPKWANMLLTEEEQTEIRQIIVNRKPGEFGLPGSLLTLQKVCEYVRQKYRKKMSDRCACDYMRRWGLSCQRPVKRARKQDPSRV